MSFTETLQSITGKLLADCTDQELYLALLELVRGGRIALDDRGTLTMRRTRPERNKENPGTRNKPLPPWRLCFLPAATP